MLCSRWFISSLLSSFSVVCSNFGYSSLNRLYVLLTSFLFSPCYLHREYKIQVLNVFTLDRIILIAHIIFSQAVLSNEKYKEQRHLPVTFWFIKLLFCYSPTIIGHICRSLQANHYKKARQPK